MNYKEVIYKGTNNLSNNSNQPAKIQRNISFSSQASSSSTQTLKTLSNKILYEVVTDLNNTIIEKLESDRIEITLSFDTNNLSNNSNQPAKIQRNISFSSQASSSSTQTLKTLSNKILYEVVTDLNNTIIEKLESDRIEITLSFDTINVSGKCHKTDDIIAKTEEIITEIRELNLVILVIIIDSALAYNAQVNLCIDEIFKVSPKFKTTSTYALKIAGIRDGIVTLLVIQSLATKFKPFQLNARRRPNDLLTIFQNIYSIIMNENFWKNLIKLEKFYKKFIVSNIINSTLETETQDNKLETEIQEVNSKSKIQDINHKINIQDIDLN
ncbi:hypothetical protein Glove_26g268 [Diversispora epigaea]|uniref:Uncharacterized protein n=1 Tax=Diversispora epigaea TaxID=1348612 RepID=A0A397JJ71_9GLOM|nr:hypothetical protein Glove_26g268 [Diversispora epigaea]